MTAPRRRTGMTLMELVIGIAITGIMAAVGVGAFSSIIDHRERIQATSLNTERAAAQREMIQSWIAGGNVQIPRGGGPRGVTTALFNQMSRIANPSGATNTASVSAAQAAGDDISFTTTALNPSLLGNVRIRLYVDADPNTPESGLSIEYQPSAQLPLVRKMLDSTIDSLHVDYLDQRTNTWHPATEAATITPMAVRLSLHTIDSTQSPLITVPLIFPIGNPNLSPASRALGR